VLDRAVAGVCPYCSGRIAIESLAGATEDRVPQGKVSFAAVCADCEGTVRASAAALASFEPAVIAFLHRRGVDTRTPLWEQNWFHDATATVIERDPPTVAVTVAAGGDELRLTVDGDGEVTDVEGPEEAAPGDP